MLSTHACSGSTGWYWNKNIAIKNWKWFDCSHFLKWKSNTFSSHLTTDDYKSTRIFIILKSNFVCGQMKSFYFLYTFPVQASLVLVREFIFKSWWIHILDWFWDVSTWMYLLFSSKIWGSWKSCIYFHF